MGLVWGSFGGHSGSFQGHSGVVRGSFAGHSAVVRESFEIFDVFSIFFEFVSKRFRKSFDVFFENLEKYFVRKVFGVSVSHKRIGSLRYMTS